MKTLKMVIAVLITMGFIFSQQAIGAGIKTDDSLIPPDNYIKSKKQTVNKVERKKIIKKKIERRPVPKGPGDPDLMAEIIRITPGPGGAITIQGRITNIGSGDFISGAGQAAGQIVVSLIHGRGPSSLIYLDNDPITRLNSHRSINLQGTYRIPEFEGWGHESLEEGDCEAELAVEFIVWVAYDPDILMDGNDGNDDCDYSNNEVRRSSLRMPEVRDYKTHCLE